MPTKQPKKSSSESSISTKKNWQQFNEDRYKRMSDGKFIEAFENDNIDDMCNDFYTPIKRKLIPFILANINRNDREDFQDIIEDDDSELIDWLASYPDLIDRLPHNILWEIHPDERLSLLLRIPEKADQILPSLQGEDIWAIMLPGYCIKNFRLGIKLCPWKTMTQSQLRYMKLKSKKLKEFIETHKLE